MEISVHVPPKQKEIVEIDLPHAFDHKLNASCYMNTFSSLLTATLFTVASTWKQHRSPSTNAWIMKYAGGIVTEQNNNRLLRKLKFTGKCVNLDTIIMMR